jgi:hypothetical protein
MSASAGGSAAGPNNAVATRGGDRQTAPTTTLDHGRVVGRPRLISFSPTVTAHLSDGGQMICAWPWAPTDWKPAFGPSPAQTGVTMGPLPTLCGPTEPAALNVITEFASAGQVAAWQLKRMTRIALSPAADASRRPEFLADRDRRKFGRGNKADTCRAGYLPRASKRASPGPRHARRLERRE